MINEEERNQYSKLTEKKRYKKTKAEGKISRSSRKKHNIGIRGRLAHVVTPFNMHLSLLPLLSLSLSFFLFSTSV